MVTRVSQSEAWTRYWVGGMTESCFSGGRAVTFEAAWSAFCDSVPAGARILDLACGAGSALRILQKQKPGLAMTGVDCATSLPAAVPAEMIPGVALEKLPFEDHSFDAVISQFGFEYAEQVAASAEAVRVLKPGGRLQFILHNADGPAIADAKRRRERMEPLLADTGLVPALGRLAGAVAAQDDPAIRAREAEKSWQAAREAPAQDETTQWALSFSADLLRDWQRFEPAYLRDNARTLERELSFYHARINAMIEAALDESGIDALACRLQDLGCSIDPPRPLKYRNDPVAWRLTASRSG